MGVFINKKLGDFDARYFPATEQSAAFLEIEVASSDPNKPDYTVLVGEDGKLDCTCPSFFYRMSCRHVSTIKSVIDAKRAENA